MAAKKDGSGELVDDTFGGVYGNEARPGIMR